MFDNEEFLRIANRPSVQVDLSDIKINESDKKRIVDYIKENELNYIISEENDIFRFFITAQDKAFFQFLKYNEQYVVAKTMAICGQAPTFQYFYFKNLQQVIEQLSLYDNNIPKVWWELLDGRGRNSTVDIVFVKENYTDDWSKEFLKNDWSQINEQEYKCLVYEKKVNIRIKSPHDKYDDYPGYDLQKLYMEIHPICVKEGSESYLVKILINNEEVLKEYLNYRVIRKKGLKLFLNEFFNNKNPYIKFL